jgi:adenine deaminase
MRYSNSEKGENSRLYGIIEANNKDRYGNGTDEIVDLKRKITLAKGKTKVDLVIKNARIINVFSGDVYQTDAGMNDMDMLTAVRHISSIGGGLSVALDSEVIASLPLPIAGLISDMPIESVILSLEALNGACLKLGSNVIKDPFMLLSFLALHVIPSLKLTDKGLVDVDKFQFTDLWVNHRYSDKN